MLPDSTRGPLGLRPGQRLLVRANAANIGPIPCEPLHTLRGFLARTDTDPDDIQEREERGASARVIWLDRVLRERPECRPLRPTDRRTKPAVGATIVLHPVWRWALWEAGEAVADRAMGGMHSRLIAPLHAGLALACARLAGQHRLPTADSIMYTTELAHGATIWPQAGDSAGLKNIDNVPKRPAANGRPT